MVNQYAKNAVRHCALVILLFLGCTTEFSSAEPEAEKTSRFPYPEKLSFHIEWHTITAGFATVEMSRTNPDDWETVLHLESTGMATRLYRVLDTYKVTSNDKFCAANSVLDSQEGKRHKVTRLSFENTTHKVDYEEHDLLKNSRVRKEIEIVPCTREIAGALQALREMNLQPGKWATVAVTDGRKMANAKIEAQRKETLSLGGKTYQTIRYEAFVFDNVLYRRKGRLLIWISDDPDRLPVQLRLEMAFPIGTVTVQLDREQKT